MTLSSVNSLKPYFTNSPQRASRLQDVCSWAEDFDSKGLRNLLLETCTLTGERFAEYDEWLATEKAEKEEHWRRIKELEGDPQGLLMFALEKITGKKAADVAKTKPFIPPVTRLSLPRKPDVQQKVGRNDPCPCGSGKKYKVCCLRK